MSHTKKKSLFEKVSSSFSLKGVAFNFIKNTMMGQKLLLYNLKLPRVINISMNEQTCMYQCRMCPFYESDVRNMYKNKSEMSYETLKNIVSSVPNDSIYSFDISAIGETLSFNRLPEFISYMKGKKPKVNTIISTNALLLTEKKMQQLIESKLDNIQLSLYAHSKADYKWLTGRDSFEKVKNNVIKASELRQNMGLDKPYLQAFMMGAKEFDGIYDDFISFWNNYVDHAFIRPLYNVGKKDLNGLTPTFKKMPKRYPCVMPWYSTAIRSNGDVLACYNFHWYDKKHKIGNINKNSLTEIWNNNIINKFREDHLKLNIDKYNACKECVLWDAYTNIWDKSGKNYTYQLRTKDLFNSVNDYRGG